jgi:hypothetical protein
LGGDLKRAAHAVGRAAGAAGKMIQKGVGAVQKAIGQTPPTAQEIRQYMDSKGIPFTQAEQLIKWGVLPHTKLSADALGLNAEGNQEHWDDRLTRYIPDARARMKFIQPLVQKDIGIWLPLVESDSVQ